MKLRLILLAAFAASLISFKSDPNYFRSKLERSIDEFKENIKDEDYCEELADDIDDLAEEIDEALDSGEGYSFNDLNELRKLKKEAEMIGDYFSIIGAGNVHPQGLDDFLWANRRIGGIIGSISNNKYCVEVISVTFDDFVVYLFENQSSKSYTLTYKWKSKFGTNFGHGSMGIPNSSVRLLYSNNDDAERETFISIVELSCAEIKGY